MIPIPFHTGIIIPTTRKGEMDPRVNILLGADCVVTIYAVKLVRGREYHSNQLQQLDR